MSNESQPDKKQRIRPGKKGYPTVAKMLEAHDVPKEIRDGAARLAGATNLTRRLAAMRTQAGVTQEQMAGMLDCTQGCISKWESGLDEDLTLKIIRDYAKALNQRLELMVGPPPNDVEAVQIHAVAIRSHLRRLAKEAHKNEEMEPHIQAFFGDAFFNLLSILQEAQGQMPHQDSIDIRLAVQDLTQKASASSRRTVLEESVCC